MHTFYIWSAYSTMMTRQMGPSFSRRTLSRQGPHPLKWRSVRLARSDGWIYVCQSSRRRLNDVGNHPLLVEGLQRHGSALPKLWARSFFTVLRPGTGESHTCRLGTGTRLCGHACAPRPLGLSLLFPKYYLIIFHSEFPKLLLDYSLRVDLLFHKILLTVR